MAHFAKLDSNNIVTNVVTVDNVNLQDANGVEQESIGIAYLQMHLGDGPWVQTSYNGKIRGKYAGIGNYYDAAAYVFTSPPDAPSE